MSYALKYVPDQYKTREMYAEAVHIESHVLKSIPDWYKT